ncbi:MAG: hypothetical protein COW13_02945 [Candidatus Omnitrophica bacterium CG12_big_fil_rev_8_21_14_0_65_50_5]|nr:MAG: hypothetical protein COW13_02945 [Candidatus Omnitrophica bacterium CG12_big_fil_rev_8_21_14_0_65_50_5]
MESSNPIFNSKVLSQGYAADPAGTMTVNGAVNKSFILLALLLLPAFWAWGKVAGLYSAASEEAMMAQAAVIKQLFGWSIAASIGGLVIAVVLAFKKQWAPVLAPVYALTQGFVIGGLSAYYEVQFSGIVMNAAGLTIATLLCLLSVYKMGWIKVTRGFALGMMIAVGAIALIYIVDIIASLFGHPMPMIHSNGPVAIGFSLVVVGIAAFSLILDFDFFERGAQAGLPKYMEWYAAFGLMVTLIWLYLEILRLLSKLRSRN